ncbi:hypothetical protein CASFOL_012485 [Castilleja foliolosa]|uniref:Uncharacterized protein n=1 Tax=Castilleja foliolosa TaxID=1961234 RepID=A0ABD3DH70_9LAMI
MECSRLSPKANFVDLVLSWSPQDIVDHDLYKNQVYFCYGYRDEDRSQDDEPRCDQKSRKQFIWQFNYII